MTPLIEHQRCSSLGAFVTVSKRKKGDVYLYDDEELEAYLGRSSAWPHMRSNDLRVRRDECRSALGDDHATRKLGRLFV